jgi:hypothetical protein
LAGETKVLYSVFWQYALDVSISAICFFVESISFYDEEMMRLMILDQR